MYRLYRHLICFSLLAVISLSSVSFAAARGQAPAVGTMVICTGTGPVHIVVDKNGQPTGQVVICPDYATAFYADVFAAAPSATRCDIWQAVWHSAISVNGPSQTAPAPQARGPPLSV